MGCTKISKTNKGESNLFNTIYNGVANGNEQLATYYYNWFESKRFKEIFGFDYIDAYKKGIQSDRVDENGEPKLLYDKERSLYYFLDKNNLKSYFPSSSKGLSKTWSGQQIKNVTSRLVSSYFKKYSHIDFNNIDFSTLKDLPNLDKFIKHEINKKIAKLNEIVDNGTEDEADVALAKLGYLEDASKNLNELKELVVKKFKDIGADYSEDEDNDDYSEDVKETSREGVVGKASMERSSRSKVTANVKLRLSLLDDLENKDELWDDFTLLEFDKVYKKLQELLSNKIPLEGEFLYDNFVKIINENVKYFPYLKQLNQMLADNKDENFPYEFTQAFYKAKNTFVNEEYKKNEFGYTQETLDLSNKTEKKVIIKNKLIQGYTSRFVSKDANGNLDFLETSKQSLLDSIKSLKEKFNSSATLSNEHKLNVKNIEDFKSFTLNTLKKLGLNISDKGFNHYIGYPIDTTLEESTIEEKIKIFNNIYNLVAKLSNYAFKIPTTDVNKIFNSTDVFNKLIDSEVFVSDNDMSEDMIRIGGQKRYVFSNPSHLHMELERWKQDPSILLKEYYNDPYMDGARLVKEWFELDKNQDKPFEELVEIGRKNLKNVKLGVLGEMTLGGVKNKFQKTTDLGIKDYFTNNINSVLKNQGFVRTITQADKSTEFVFKTLVNRIKGYLGYNTALNEFEITDEVKKTYFNYYLSELKRALRANQVVDEAIKNNDYSQLTPHYHFQYEIKDKDGNTIINPNRFDKSGNAFKSQYFDKLNIKTAKTDIEKEIVNIIYNKDGSLKIKDLSTFTLNDLELESKFGEYLQKMITSEARETLKEMKNLGIIELKNGGYINKLLDTNLVSEYTEGVGQIAENSALTKIAINYMINGISNNIEFTKLFTGDIAYYKNPVDFKKRVPATYTDGKYLLLKKGEEAFNIATIEAVIQDSPFLEALKKDNDENGVDAHTIEMLSNINSTDAQAWITPERWYFLKVRLGEGSNLLDEVYRKMQSDKNEEWSKEELKLAAQPVKGVYFYKINGKPTYLKYSQAVLSKAMIKGTDLERVFNKMVENKIDELITFDGVKVGSITPTKIHDENGKVLPDDQLTFNVQTLNNHGWKLQQDLPVKNFKNTDVGSQIQKNILAGLKHFLENANFTFKGKKITGEELQNELVKTVGNLSDEGYRRLINKAGIDKDGKITNTRKFYKSLITELKSRGGSENLINALESETTLFGIPQATGKIFQIFASMINKAVIKIQTNGGSFIQMADFGLSLEAVTRGKSGIRLNPNVDGLKPPMIRTNEDGSRTVTPGSVFVPASFIAKDIPNWKDYTAHELFVSYNGGHPIIDHRIQENIIGYRIPNQGLPSNDALTIAGILPEAAGDTIVAYVGITSKTGSDYDIDKMYVMFPQYEKIIDKTTEEAVFAHIEKNFKGINNEETLTNYKNFLDKFEELDSETLSGDFISTYKSKETKEDKTLFLRDVRKELIKQIVNNTEHKQVKSIFKELEFKTIGLKYSTKGFAGEQNKLIEIYKSVLTNPEVYSDIMKSIDNDFIKKEINSLKPDETSSFMNAMNPRDDVKLRYSFLGGKAGVGMEANAMTDIWRTGKLVISNLANFTWGNYDKTTKETELDKEYSEELSEEDLNYYVSQMVKEDAPKERVEEFKNSIRKIKIGETLGTILNAFVDIAKDPYITKGNWTTSTTNVGNLMMRMGIHPLYVINFLGNPIIEEYIQFQQNNEGLFDNNSGDIFNKFLEYINTTYGEYDKKPLNLFDRTTNQHNEFKLNLEYFRNSIKNKDNVDLNFRITLLNEFRNIQSSSKFLKSIVDFGKLDVNGIGKDPNMIFQYEGLLKEILENAEKTIDENGKPIKGVIKGFESKLDNTILSKYYNNLLKIKTVLEQNPSMFPMSIENVRGIIKTMVNDITKSYSKKGKMSEEISKGFRTYIYLKVFDIQDSDRKKVIDNMPKYLQKFQLENKGKYFMIDNLNVNGDEIGLNNSDRSLEFQRMFTNSWEQLFEDHPQFAESLVKYSYLTSGFNSNRTQFYSYIPFEYFIKLNINGKLNDIFSKGNFDEFENKFYLNNLNDTSIVKNVLAKDVSLTPNNENGLISEKNKGQFITVNSEYYRLIGKNEDNSFVYIKINNTPVTNDYNVELQLNSFDDSILKVGEPLEVQEEQPIAYFETKQEVNNLNEEDYSNAGLSYDEIYKYGNTIYTFYKTGNAIQGGVTSNNAELGYGTKAEKTYEDVKQKGELIKRENLKFDKQIFNQYKEFHPDSRDLSFITKQEVKSEVSKINIYAGTNENSELSNFAIRPFTINVETPSGSKEFNFQSVEQGFHFYKAIVAENPTVGKKILETTNGGQLRSLTNRNNLSMTLPQVKEWDETSKSIMLNLMYDSYAQNPKEAQKLLNTGNATITHTQDNTRWKTDFPEVVMTVRDMLKEEGFGDNEVTTVAKSEIVSKTSIQMQPQNVEKILNGTKTTTIRESISKGGNIAVGETKLVNFSGKDFYVTNRGHLTIQEAGGLENMLKSEGLKSIDDFMYNQSKNWAKGNGKMYVFDIKESKEVKSEVSNMNELINHSGGAKGGDMTWDSIGKEFGVTNHNHYTTKYFDNLSPEEQVELSQQYLQTVKWLGRGVINSESYAGKLVRRDMIQANNSDGIFGITELIKPGINGRKGYNNKTNHSIPEGGTGYAVTRGILTNKPTFVFNQSNDYGNEIGWYKWNPQINDFIKVDTPILTKNYAGIGSQEINELGIQAIKDVYEKTKNSLSEIKNVNKPQQLSLFDNLQESKTMSILKDMFNQNLMINRFNELNINNIEDLENSSEDQLGELLKKICK